MTVFGFGHCTWRSDLVFCIQELFPFYCTCVHNCENRFYIWFFTIIKELIIHNRNYIVQFLEKLHYTHGFESVQLWINLYHCPCVCYHNGQVLPNFAHAFLSLLSVCVIFLSAAFILLWNCFRLNFWLGVA